MQQCDYGLYLCHHGVKGQKWGIRRFQKKDGTLTPAGKKRYDDSPDKSKKPVDHEKWSNNKSYNKYYEKYKAAGCSEEQARRTARGRVITNRVLIGVGAAATAAAAAYVGYKIHENRADRYIKSDQLLQTVHKGGDKGARKRLGKDNPFYATYKKADETIYGSTYFTHFGEDSSITKFKVDGGVKVASRHSGKKAFEHLIKTDKEFAKIVEEEVKGGWYAVHKGTYLNQAYDDFNHHLVLRGRANDKFHRKFYDELGKRGYQAVSDTFDAKTCSLGHDPIIIFGAKNQRSIVNTVAASKHDLSDDTLMKAYNLNNVRMLLNKPAKVVAPVVTTGAAVGSVTNTVTTNKFIKQYRRDHPNTKLSNKEIINIYKAK